MPTLKKVRLVIDEYLVNEREAIDALAILDLGLKLFFKEDRTIFNNQMKAFQNTYHHSHLDTANPLMSALEYQRVFVLKFGGVMGANVQDVEVEKN